MALAARTKKLHVGLMVGGVTYRNPAFFAKQTTTIDVLSGGRAIFGIGAAWFEAEHKAFGYRFPPIAERFEHLEDALRISRAMFTEDQPTVEGTHSSVHEIYNNPRPIRGDIPIMIGGSGEKKTLRMVAQYADARTCSASPRRSSTWSACCRGTATTWAATSARSPRPSWRRWSSTPTKQPPPG